jgi:hypothetical protein
MGKRKEAKHDSHVFASFLLTFIVYRLPPEEDRLLEELLEELEDRLEELLELLEERLGEEERETDPPDDLVELELDGL